jgi:hypothetical protein
MGTAKLANHNHTQFKFHLKLIKLFNFVMINVINIPKYQHNKSKIYEMQFKTFVRMALGVLTEFLVRSLLFLITLPALPVAILFCSVSLAFSLVCSSTRNNNKSPKENTQKKKKYIYIYIFMLGWSEIVGKEKKKKKRKPKTAESMKQKQKIFSFWFFMASSKTKQGVRIERRVEKEKRCVRKYLLRTF